MGTEITLRLECSASAACMSFACICVGELGAETLVKGICHVCHDLSIEAFQTSLLYSIDDWPFFRIVVLNSFLEGEGIKKG